MISPISTIETNSIGKNVTIMEYVVIRKNVIIEDNVIIHPNVVIEEGAIIGAGCEIFPGTYIGKIPKGVGATARPTSYKPMIKIGQNCAIGPNAVIFYDVEIGSNTLIGDGASLREQVVVGDYCLISRYVTVNYNTKIGSHTRIMDLTHITGNCIVGDNVFISTLVSTVNDNAVIDRVYEDKRIIGPTIESGATIGAAATLMPGITIHNGAFVGAGAVATKDVAPFDLVMGIPAKVVKNIKPQ